ncbi:hypothetical protein MCY90_17045 [Bacillus pumilus]|uniref:hypothetical protein n=1 Tax=Bacillus pumilus TaxID=1408 RepID=UPI00228072FC|nr:hypothetical protein [Bacillus pumilus]MCY7437060.1 hypothetical protein [Bacillus pumilus]MEB2356928.1 hypothetical protein [Bacillus pumilus]
MANLTRILRLRDAEIWEYEFLDNQDIIIYFSITDVNRKATIHDNPLATQSELDERDNYLSIDIHSNVDLKKTIEGDAFEDFITEISFLVEHMHDFHNAHVFMKMHVHDNIDLTDFQLEADEDLHGDEKEQLYTFKHLWIKQTCFQLIEQQLNRKIKEISNSRFCQDLI